MKRIFAALLLITSISFAQENPPAAKPADPPAGGMHQIANNALKVKAGDQVIDFKLNDLAAKEVDSAALRKDKVFILAITPHNSRFSTEHIEMLNAVADKFLGKIIILNVVANANLTREELIDYYNKANASFPIVIDEKKDVIRQYGHFVSPAVLVIDKDGKIVEAFNYRFHYNPGAAQADIIAATEKALSIKAEEKKEE